MILNEFNETAKLVKEVTSWYKQTSDITKFDNDKDGYIDAVCLIYGAPNMLSDKVKNGNNPNSAYKTSITLI